MNTRLKPEEYWPERKVYLYGTCALFPENISDKVLSADEMDVYVERGIWFDDEPNNNQENALKKYETKGMLKVEVLEDDKFKITNINQEKFKAELVEYLEKFRYDELVADPSIMPEPHDVLKDRLRMRMDNVQRPQPLINLLNIWPEWSSWSNRLYPFWEIIFSSELLPPYDWRVRNIGYKSVGESTFSTKDVSLPFATIEALATTQPAKPEPATGVVRLDAISDAKPMLNLTDVKLNENSYDKKRGVLHLTPYHAVTIPARGKVRRKDGKKYLQCVILECVFKSVKTLEQGTTFSKIIGVNASIMNDSKKRSIENTVAEINKKIMKDNGPKNLIKIQKGKVFLNNSYL